MQSLVRGGVGRIALDEAIIIIIGTLRNGHGRCVSGVRRTRSGSRLEAQKCNDSNHDEYEANDANQHSLID